MTSTRRITVMGATGNVGGALARRLLDDGLGVRALGRSADRLAPLAERGAEPRVGDAGDAGFLADAFAGSDGVFALLPYDPAEPDYPGAQRRIGEAVASALAAAGVPRVVLLSSIGADRPSGTGPVASLHEQEERLRRLPGTEVLALRPGSFFENFAAAIEPLLHGGVHGDTVAPGVPVPMIAARDVAAAAAAALAAPAGPDGSAGSAGFAVRELHGPRDLSYAEATAILGEHLGVPGAAYVQLAEEEMDALLRGAGYSAGMARLQLELNRALTEGTVAAREPRTAKSTTPTTFEAFAAELARGVRVVA